MAFPPNNAGSLAVAGGSFTSTSRILPLTSPSLKSSHLYSGDVTPYPANTISACAALDGTADPAQMTTSSGNRSCPAALPDAVTRIDDESTVTTSIGTR